MAIVNYIEIPPCAQLKPFIKCFYLYESSADTETEDRAFASGCIEVMFNIGEGRWQVEQENDFIITPRIELWGQIIKPLRFKSIGKNLMLGVRFFPHTATYFLHNSIEQFNDRIFDFAVITGNDAGILHSKLIETSSLQHRIKLLESFLLNMLAKAEKKRNKSLLIHSIMQELRRDDFFDNIENVASAYGITARYLQKLFVQHTGLSPKLYCKINRFQNSLLLIAKQNATLTSVAYDCGYFDQSHFIREFKLFTGSTPSACDVQNSSAILISPDK